MMTAKVASASNGNGGGGGFRKVFAVLCVLITVFLFGYAAVSTLIASVPATETGGNGVAVNPTSVDPNIVSGRGGLTEVEVQQNTIDFTDEEWNSWMNQGAERTAQFNVDVYIPDSHAALTHGAEEMNAALRCVQQNGTVGVLSSTHNRRLQLLCVDPETKREFVVIIEQLKRSVDAFKNTTSQLVTAFELKVEGQWLNTNIASYIHSEVNLARTSILVRLAWKAGEIFFSPYR